MNDSLRGSAKLAREFLEMMAEGIGRVESGAGSLSKAGVAALSSRLPARWGGRSSSSSTYALAAIVAAGVVATTAALIYSRSRSRDSRGRRR